MAKEKRREWFWANLIVGGFLASVTLVRTFSAAFFFKSMPGRYSPETSVGQSAEQFGAVVGGLMMLGLCSAVVLYGVRGLRRQRPMQIAKEVDHAADTSSKGGAPKSVNTDAFAIELSNRWVWAGVVLVTLFVVFVWPTFYYYDSMALGGGTHFPVRVNRITGSAERLLAHGWEPMERSEASVPNGSKMQVGFSSDVARLEMRNIFIEGTWLKAHFFNGTDNKIEGLAYNLTAKTKSGEIISRSYKDTSFPVAPNVSEEFAQNVGLQDVELQSIRITSALVAGEWVTLSWNGQWKQNLKDYSGQDLINSLNKMEKK